jgi:hypothetical protein
MFCQFSRLTITTTYYDVILLENYIATTAIFPVMRYTKHTQDIFTLLEKH